MWQNLVFFCVALGCSLSSYAVTQCSTVINSNDQVAWDRSKIELSKRCQTFTVTLVHEGYLDKSVMGHSWVLTKAEDKAEVVKLLMVSKDSDYVKDDSKIIAYTPLIGGGENTTITFDTSKLQLGQSYVYFCSYPEHNDMMQGELILLDN